MKKFKLPTALTIVMIFLAVVGILTWFVPTSVVVTDDLGNKVIHFNAAFDAAGNIIENAGTSPVGLWDFFMAPISGFASAASVAATILVSGGLLAVLNYSAALDAGIGALIRRFSGKKLIVILMLVFALMGTVYGSWEELPAYVIIIVPLFVSAGYDVITGMMVILIGAVVGNMASVVNPYSIGAAVAAIGNEELSLGSGLLLRLVLFAVLFVMGAFSVIRYAEKIKKDPSKSAVASLPGIKTNVVHENSEAVEANMSKMTGRHKASLIVFVIVILLCVIGYVPWDAIPVGDKTAFDYVNAFQTATSGTFLGNLLGVNSFNPFGWWYFDEFSLVWLVGAIAIGVINKMDEKKWVSVFAGGAKDLVGVVLVLSVSRGVSIFMGSKQAGMSITFVYWIQKLLSSVPLWAFAIVGICVYMLIALFVQSSSGVAGITMPIFGSLAFLLFAGTSAGSLSGQVVLLSAFTCGHNFTCALYPSATNMGICEMTNVPYNVFLKQWAKILTPLLIVAAGVISVAPYIGLA